MAIEKNSFKVSRFDTEFSPNSRGTMSSDEDELQRRSSAIDESSDDDDEYDDADSGAGSDDFDLLELGEGGAEFCQVGNLTCSVPFELYDLPSLEDILTVDVWNDLLTEEEKFSLTKHLPDMDQDTFMRTLKELFEGKNFHFGSPIKMLFAMLKGGLCEPRVALYREGLNFFQKRQHYHTLRKHQNIMVSNLCHIRDAWSNCRGYSIEEKLRVLNIMESQRSLMYEKLEDLESDSSGQEVSGEGLWSKRVKDKKGVPKMAHHSPYALDIPQRGQAMGLEPAKYGKQNAKGILKMAGSRKPFAVHDPSGYCGMDSYSGMHGSGVALSRQNRAAQYESGTSLWKSDHFGADYDDVGDPLFGTAVQKVRNVSHDSMMDKYGDFKLAKKPDFTRGEELARGSFVGLSMSSKNDMQDYRRKKIPNQVSEMKAYTTKPYNVRTPAKFCKKAKDSENAHQTIGDYMKSLKGRVPQLPVKGSQADIAEYAEPFWFGRTQGEVLSRELPFTPDSRNVKIKKWKTGKESPDLRYKSYRASSPQMDNKVLHPEYRVKPSQQKIRGLYVQNGGQDMLALKRNKMFVKNDETESDSSEQFDDDDDDGDGDGDDNPLMRRKIAFPVGVIEGSRSSLLKSGHPAKKTKLIKNDARERWAHDGITFPSKKISGLGDLAQNPAAENNPLTAKQKGKMCDSSPFHSSVARVLEDNSVSSLGILRDDDRKHIHKLGRNGQLRGESKTFPADRKQKADLAHEYFVNEEEDSLEKQFMLNGSKGRQGKKVQNTEGCATDRRGRSEASLLECKSVMKKRKAKEDVVHVHKRDKNQQQIDDSTSFKKKGKRRLDAETAPLDIQISEALIPETGVTEVEHETKPQKKPFTLITPTVHSGFSFSIVHLLSAVRMAMITLSEDSLEVDMPREEQSKKHVGQVNGHEGLPSLTVQEIVNRVKSNPGDPCVLETQEPLQDLIRGVLKIYSSKTAPLGAKGWKALVAYEKSTKTWSWIGPTQISTDHESVEEVTSPEAWGLPHKMLVKLVDSFANWLKSGQDTLQQIGSLPPPPASLLQFNLDEKDRFRDLRAQKSLNTISPSTEEVRAYFRREEFLRYSIPDRAFSYTAADGKKSIVAPLRRCGGKPTSKARDHFMLKRDRPPHVTILCLVRDAAARLPGSIGTRADVCTLIRDSQYIVEDVSDAQVNQVVSGALDRLHYERDPCVQFDSERKLWVYLHRDREEEDFEDDGTSSTKKWKRQKKDPTEQSDQGPITVAFHGAVDQDQSGFDLGSDLNVEPLMNDDDKKQEPVCGDVKQTADVNIDTGSEQGNTQGHPMVWEALDLNPVQQDKLLCQENSTNEDFDDETFGRERPGGLVSAGLL